MKPSVGRIVHYIGKPSDVVIPTGSHCAAIVTAVVNEEASAVYLNVFHPVAGNVNVFDVKQDEAGAEGTWHWPEREG